MSDQNPVTLFLIAVFVSVNSVRENKKGLSSNLSSKSAAEELQTRSIPITMIGLDTPSPTIDSSYRGTLSKYPKSMLSSVSYVIRPDAMKCICHLRPMGVQPGSDLLLSFEYSWLKGRNIDGRAGKFEGSVDLLCNMNFFERCNSSVRCLKFMEVKEEEFSIYLRGLVSPSTLGIEIKKRSSNSGQIYILSQDRSLFALPLSTSTYRIKRN